VKFNNMSLSPAPCHAVNSFGDSVGRIRSALYHDSIRAMAKHFRNSAVITFFSPKNQKRSQRNRSYCGWVYEGVPLPPMGSGSVISENVLTF